MSRYLPLSLVVSVAIGLAPVGALAEKSMSDQELNAVMASWGQRCQDYAVGEGRPDLKRKCVNLVLGDVADVDQLRADPAVTDQIWNLCKIESGFNHTQDFHQWVACMRVAKTRPWMQNR